MFSEGFKQARHRALGVARDIALAAFSVLLLLLVTEVGLRIAGVKYDASLYQRDRELGYALRPNAEGWSVQEQANYERISSEGLRDRFHEITRPPNTIRIAVVGASYSEAKEVPLDAAYWAIMEGELNRLLPPGGPKVEVINFGVAGYGLPQDYLVIRDRIWRYDPQIVILAGTLHSIVLETTRTLAVASPLSGPVPYFVRRNGHLELDDQTLRERRSFVSPSRIEVFLQHAINRSLLLSLLNNARRAATAQVQGLRHLPSPAAGAAGNALDYEDFVLKGPVTPELASAWRIAEDLLQMCQTSVEHHNAEFWFFLFDMAPQVDPDPLIRADERRKYGIDDLFAADRLFDKFTTKHGIRHEMLAQELLAAASKNGVLLHGFPGRPRNSGHWNIAGNRIAGLLVARKLLNCSAAIATKEHRETQSSCSHDPPLPTIEETLAP